MTMMRFFQNGLVCGKWQIYMNIMKVFFSERDGLWQVTNLQECQFRSDLVFNLSIACRKFRHDLGKATAATRAALSYPTCICYVLLFTCSDAEGNISINFAKAAGETSPSLLQFPTAWGSFICAARSTLVQHAFHHPKD